MRRHTCQCTLEGGELKGAHREKEKGQMCPRESQKSSPSAAIRPEPRLYNGRYVHLRALSRSPPGMSHLEYDTYECSLQHRRVHAHTMAHPT